jgi:hypothetical protein
MQTYSIASVMPYLLTLILSPLGKGKKVYERYLALYLALTLVLSKFEQRI